MNTQKLIHKLNAYERLMRLDKPIGILLLLWPTLWALLIAGQGKPDWIVVLIFVTGTVLMRSAGCVLNDIADSRFDRFVARTQDRPLATQEVSKKEAYLLAGVLAVTAFALVCMLNTFTIQLSVLALLLAASYPYTKRFLAVPQAYLGIAFGFGIPMAFAALMNYLPPICWVLLAANIFWAIAYDTEYAMIDRDDDVKLGLRSSAITFGRFDVLAVMLCYGLALLLLAIGGKWLLMGGAYFIGLAIAACTAIYHYSLIRSRQKTKCFQAFLGNNWFGFAIFAGLSAEYALRYFKMA
ncbi:MAG: 4-hydroxybenzoate octaprenyltransferase [Methylotenera sp.]|nr:MAG: 4-hydroxybenzoate octaprenyltransferase [Methylotenera sp.]